MVSLEADAFRSASSFDTYMQALDLGKCTFGVCACDGCMANSFDTYMQALDLGKCDDSVCACDGCMATAVSCTPKKWCFVVDFLRLFFYFIFN